MKYIICELRKRKTDPVFVIQKSVRFMWIRVGYKNFKDHIFESFQHAKFEVETLAKTDYTNYLTKLQTS